MTERVRSRQADHQRKLVALGCCRRCQRCRGCGAWEVPLARARHHQTCQAKPKYADVCDACMVGERERQATYRKRMAASRARTERRNAARRAKRRAA